MPAAPGLEPRTARLLTHWSYREVAGLPPPLRRNRLLPRTWCAAVTPWIGRRGARRSLGRSSVPPSDSYAIISVPQVGTVQVLVSYVAYLYAYRYATLYVARTGTPCGLVLIGILHEVLYSYINLVSCSSTVHVLLYRYILILYWICRSLAVVVD